MQTPFKCLKARHIVAIVAIAFAWLIFSNYVALAKAEADDSPVVPHFKARVIDWEWFLVSFPLGYVFAWDRGTPGESDFEGVLWVEIEMTIMGLAWGAAIVSTYVALLRRYSQVQVSVLVICSFCISFQ